ncbi:hypothetical protein GE09DRAFT_1160208 [Coniochaeta sp. 2T2.1]|nr:hypothetical protein GE09DRAFT_1160208 [Coniochaeta sp. 2T2.1]
MLYLCTIAVCTTTMTRISTLNHLTVFVTFHIKIGQTEAWKEAHMGSSRAEPKCIYFDVFHNGNNKFRLVEVWDATKEWFENVQLKKEYYAALWVLSKPTWERDMEIEYFERLGEGMSWKQGFWG